MLKKRLITAIIVKNDIAVQSFSYSKYLPLGSPLIFVENYNRWNVDEILIQSIDRSRLGLGPDFKLLNRISSKTINTPLIYGGGIRTVNDARNVIKIGADRIIIGDLLLKKPNGVKRIAEVLGEQAIILSLPILHINKTLYIYDYINNKNVELRNFILKNNLNNSCFEFMFSDVKNDGERGKFDINIIKKNLVNNIIVFGGINPDKDLDKIYKFKNVSGICIGNSFSYTEHSYQKSVIKMKNNYLRSEIYKSKWK